MKIFSLFFSFCFCFISAKKEVTANQCDLNTWALSFLIFNFHPGKRKKFRNFLWKKLHWNGSLCFFCTVDTCGSCFKSSNTRWPWVFNVFVLCANWNIAEIRDGRAIKLLKLRRSSRNHQKYFSWYFPAFYLLSGWNEVRQIFAIFHFNFVWHSAVSGADCFREAKCISSGSHFSGKLSLMLRDQTSLTPIRLNPSHYLFKAFWVSVEKRFKFLTWKFLRFSL